MQTALRAGAPAAVDSGMQTLESRMPGKRACPVWGGAVGKGLSPVPRRRPTLLGEGPSEKGWTTQHLAGGLLYSARAGGCDSPRPLTSPALRSPDLGYPSTLSLSRYAEDVTKLAAALDIRHYALLGHSHGAFITLAHAIRTLLELGTARKGVEKATSRPRFQMATPPPTRPHIGSAPEKRAGNCCTSPARSRSWWPGVSASEGASRNVRARR